MQPTQPKDPVQVVAEPAIKKPANELRHFLLEVLQIILLAVVLYIAVDAIIARVRVENISMEPTLYPNEFLLVNRLAYKLGSMQRGDVVVFRYPLDPTQDYIKRLIGLPGDHIEVKLGTVYVNGNALNEPYISAKPLYDGDWTVPVGAVFVLGDNRNSSDDSHHWGYVPLDNIIGKAIVVYWPFNAVKSLELTQPLLAVK